MRHSVRSLDAWSLGAWIAVVAAATTFPGCVLLSSSNSFSESSGSASSLSDSISDSSTSSSASSSGEDTAALQRDVRTYTALFTESGAEVDAYLRGVGALCEHYAVSDWERDPAVHRGIALGLADSRLSAHQIDAFAAQVAGGDPTVQETLRAEALGLR